MKTDREFMDSVKSKIAIERENRKRRVMRYAGIAAVLTICIGSILYRTNSASRRDPQIIDSNPSDIVVSFLLCSEGIHKEDDQILANISVTDTGQNCELPVEGKLTVERVSGMNEEEKNNRRATLNDSVTEQWLKEKRTYYVNGVQSENYIASLAIQGNFIISVNNASGINICAECSEIGILWTETESSTRIYGTDTLLFHYDISEKMLELFENNPNTSYEDIKDEIVCTVSSNDGTIQIFTIRIGFDAEGNMTADYIQGNEV